MDTVIGSICLRESGGLVVAQQSGLYFYDFDTDRLTPLANPEGDRPENRFNDGRCDRNGRFWVGSMNDVRRDPTGWLYRIDADHGINPIRDDIIVPNSICWSPDNTVMYFADTYRDIMLTYSFDAEAGIIDDPKVFADTSDTEGRPDGSAVDAEGYIWNAMFGGGRLRRYAPDGRIDREIALPVTQPSCCCFGGPDLSTLYITTATQRLAPEILEQQPLAGSLLAIDPGVQGLPEAMYRG